MKKLLIAAAVSLFAAQFATAHAAEEKKMTPQQEKMKACNKEAGDKALKGDERKAFMKECLGAKPMAKSNQQDKMKACNKEAGDKALKGDERKKFMSECLKG